VSAMGFGIRRGFGIRSALNARIIRQNRRVAPRHQYDGNDTWIRVGGSLTRRCQVLDLSRTGVRLAVTSPHSLPDTFTLILSKNSSGSRLARLKWWRGTEVGAEFVDTDSSSVSRSTADAPSANPSSASRLAADAPRINSSTGSRLTAGASKGVKPREGESQKTEKMSTLFSHTTAQQAVAKPKADLRKVVGTINGDNANSEPPQQITHLSGQVDASQGKNSKNRMDLSRLQKRLGPKHIALIHALKDVDPESRHGQELASIIESLG
jgi:hypothetical protein